MDGFLDSRKKHPSSDPFPDPFPSAVTRAAPPFNDLERLPSRAAVLPLSFLRLPLGELIPSSLPASLSQVHPPVASPCQPFKRGLSLNFLPVCRRSCCCDFVPSSGGGGASDRKYHTFLMVDASHGSLSREGCSPRRFVDAKMAGMNPPTEVPLSEAPCHNTRRLGMATLNAKR